MPIVKIDYDGEKLYCALPENLNIVDVAQAVADNFNVSVQNSVISITDHQDAKIKTVDALRHVVSKCADNIDLFIKVNFGTTVNSSVRPLITPQILLQYILDNGGTKIVKILKSHKLTGQLTESERRAVLHSVIDFIVCHFGHYPSKDVKVCVSNAVVSNFPCLGKKQGHNVIEFLYAGRKGWIVNLLKARRLKDRVVRPQNVDEGDIDDLEPLEYSAEEAAQDTEYLKITTFDSNTASLIEEKMKMTARYRHNMLCEKGVNIVKQFPFFVAHPHLIELDYSFMNTSNRTAFTDKWPTYSAHILTTLSIHEKDTDFFTCFSSDIESMLALLKLMAPKPKGRARARQDLGFQNIADTFITFLPIGHAPMNALKKNAVQPYMFACGHDPKNIIQYYIVVEREIITIPTSYTFANAFDLFFKLHFVFNIHYGDNIKGLMEFIEAFFYETGMVDTTEWMDQVFETLRGQLDV